MDPSQPLLCTVNGKTSQAIGLADRGLAFGDGLFDTLRLLNGHPSHLEFHLDRLLLGLIALNIELSFNVIQSYLSEFFALAEKHEYSQGVVKTIITRGEGRGYFPPSQCEPSVIIAFYALSSFPEEYQRQGIGITLCRHPLPNNQALAGIKHLSRLDNVLVAIEVQKKGFLEGLVCDSDGNVIEAVNRNVFVIKDRQVLTPKLQQAGVEGVMKRVICELLAPELSLSTKETTLRLDDVVTADEVFLCNSLSGIWPVNKIDGRQLSVGPVTIALQQSLRQLEQRLYKL